jgi:hypothetical protein
MMYRWAFALPYGCFEATKSLFHRISGVRAGFCRRARIMPLKL